MPGFIAGGKKRLIDTDMCFPKAKLCITYDALDDDSDDDSPILSGLPDDVSKHCLALVPRSNLPIMGSVCKKWRKFIQSQEFITVRKLAGQLEEWLYILIADSKGKGSHWEVMDSLGLNGRSLPPMPGPGKAEFGVVVVNGKLIVMAGYSSIDSTISVSPEVYQYSSCLNRYVCLPSATLYNLLHIRR